MKQFLVATFVIVALFSNTLSAGNTNRQRVSKEDHERNRQTKARTVYQQNREKNNKKKSLNSFSGKSATALLEMFNRR